MRLKKNKNIIIALLIFLIFIFWIAILPIIRYHINYKIPKSLTAQETLCYYFDCINKNNPGRANNLLINPTLDIYCCNGVYVKLKNIEKAETIKDINNYYQTMTYFVEFDCFYFFTEKNKVFEGMGDCSNFYLVKETADSNWKIHSWGLG